MEVIMAELKCKMCGGRLTFAENATVCECEFCGTYQTLPKSNDERKLNLCDRANHLRRNNEYDKAIAMYEQILQEDPDDAEIYWSMVLCRYGVEYVKDPATGKQIPTVNRMQFTSIFDDADYKAALKHCDIAQKMLFESEAKAINDIQKKILSIVENEEPFDVFICFKETDSSGRRTVDSTIANDIYYELTDSGFKVFYSPITLEDKLGTEYEPYIFAALNSAKGMIVVGTKPEYFQAPWVKNEWSRFLSLIKNGEKKKLIPAYRDMDPYDMPEEFAHLQAQDMSKIGFVQQLIRGIKLLVPKNEPAPVPVAAAAPMQATAAAPSANIPDLMRRAKVFLEDENWSNTIQCAEEAIFADPTCSDAHLYLLLAKFRVTTIAKLSDYTGDNLDNGVYFRNAMKYCDDATKKELQAANAKFLSRKLEEKYLHSFPFTDLSKFASTYAKLGHQGVYKNTFGKDVFAGKQLKELQEKLSDLMSTAHSNSDFKAIINKKVLAVIRHEAIVSGYGSTDPRCLLNGVQLLNLIAPYDVEAKRTLDRDADDIDLHKHLQLCTAKEIREEMQEAQKEYANDPSRLEDLTEIYMTWLKLKARLEKNEADTRAEEEKRREQARIERQQQIAIAEENERERKKKVKMIAIVAVIVIVGAILVNFVIMPALSGGFMMGSKTVDGVRYVKEGNYIVLSEKENKNDIPADFEIPGEMGGTPVKEIRDALKFTDIETLTIGDGVEIIGDSAFQSCQDLKRVTLPASITSIGSDAFFSCDGVESFVFAGTMAQWESIDIGSGAFAWSSIKEVTCSDGTVSLK